MKLHITPEMLGRPFSGFIHKPRPKKEPPPKIHSCALPGPWSRYWNNVLPGDLWRCDYQECGRVFTWKVFEHWEEVHVTRWIDAGGRDA